MKNSNLIKILSTVIFIGLAVNQTVKADDPCHGYDVSCDGDDCLACWDVDDDNIACEETNKAELKVALPGCVSTAKPKGLSRIYQYGILRLDMLNKKEQKLKRLKLQ